MGLVIGNIYYIKNVATGKYLNVYGNDTVANERNVNVYTKEDVLAQKWIVRLAGDGARVYTAINEAYALNINTASNNCSMYAAASNSLADSVVDFLTVDASQNLYRIKIMAHNKYLTVNSSDNAYFGTDAESFYSLWQLEDVNAAAPEPTPDPVPSEIVNQTFFVKCYNTDYNLNVYGNNTVANNTNVTVYGKENVLAQKWVAKDTSAGPKLFTKINENFCLDIYTPNSNCDMYTASAGDDDTVIEFEPYNSTQKIYKIKMFKHDKYLCADTLSDGGNVSWSSSSSGNTLWQFVDEDTMFPTPTATPTAIKDKTFFVKNYATGFNLNVYGSDTVANSRNVNVYSKENVLAQKWVAKDTSAGPKLFTKIDESFALNIYEESSNNCTMYTAAGNDNDSVLEFVPYDESLGLYRIKMFNHNKYLTVDGAESGANAYWSTVDTYSIWQFVDEDTMFPAAPGAPAEIVDKTFFLQAGDSAYYLNVHGSDTVVNTRNVDVFSLENCLAQRWVARGAEQNPKLHTKIDETFALNIYNNDCTMYTAEGNDTDSILEFVKVDTLQYKIKMYHHNKYLAVNGTPGVGVDVVWVESADSATVWKFIDESDLDLPEGSVSEAFTADSSLVTTVIPAHTNNFTAGRAANGSVISEICIHHAAGNITVDNLGALWQNPNRAGSSHYGVNGTQVGQYVKESDIAWTNGHWESNKRSVTIETANSTGDPDWLVSDETLDTLIKLVADIAIRNNLGILTKGVNLTWHSMYSATLCPGPYLLSKIDYIIEEANKLIAPPIPDGAVYIRKKNADCFLSIESSASSEGYLTKYVTKSENPQSWILVTTDNGQVIVKSDDTSFKLVVSEDGNRVMLNNSTSASPALLVSDTSDTYKIGPNISNARTTFSRLGVYGDDLCLRNIGHDTFETVTYVNAPLTGNVSSSTPTELKDKYFRIKQNGKYLTKNSNSNIVSLRDTKAEDSSQIWKVSSFENHPVIISRSDETLAISINPLRNDCNLSEYESFKLYTAITFESTGESNKYYIKASNFANKYLKSVTSVDLDVPEPASEVTGNYVMWEDFDTDVCTWEFEEAYITVNGWLRLYLNPQDRTIDHETAIPKYAFRVPKGVISNLDNVKTITYNEHYYDDDYNQISNGNKTLVVESRDALPEEIANDSTASDYDYVTAFTKENASGKNVKYTFDNNKQWCAFEAKKTVSAYTEVEKYGKIIDDDGVVLANCDGYKDYYYVAVGPKVISKDYPDNGAPGIDMFNSFTIDAVLSQDNHLYYIRCLVGDVKGHTWNNGVIQTHYQYYIPKDQSLYGTNKTLDHHSFDYTNINSYNGDINPEIACLEFIGLNPGSSGFSNYNFEKFILYKDI